MIAGRFAPWLNTHLGDQPVGFAMFGAFRLALALMVVWYHVVDFNKFAGPIAVYGFYCLSGYLMTKVVNEAYADGIAGFARYLANRALRIYPAYWCAVIVALAVLTALPDEVREAAKPFQYVGSWSDIFIWGHSTYGPSLISQSWSLGHEVVYYVAIGAILGRHRWITVVWFVFGLEVVLFGAIKGLPMTALYYSVIASSLPFATGAMIYHFHGHIPQLPKLFAVAAVLLLIAVSVLMTGDFGRAGGLYIGLCIAAAAIASLAQHPSNRIDERLGDLAYPVFLLHFSAGAVAFAAFGNKGLAVGLTAAALSMLVGSMIVIGVERPLRTLRARLRAPKLRRPANVRC